jgi:hypothetical protein
MSALAVSLALLLIQIEGGSSCPTARDVAGKLGALLPTSPTPSYGSVATLAEEPDGTLSIVLARPDGRVVVRRRLPRAESCAEQAEAAAVALAAWEAQVTPEIPLRLEQLPPAPREPTLELTRVARSHPARIALATVGGAAIASWEAGAAAPGGRLETTFNIDGAPFRPRISLTGFGQHQQKLGPGQVQWSSFYVGLGGDYGRSLGQRWRAAIGASVVFGALFADGEGYTDNRTSRTVDLGIEAMGRVEVSLGAIRPWLGAALTGWAQGRVVEVTNVGTTVLPRLEPLFAVGANYCWGP